MPTKAELYAQMAEKVTTQLTGSWQEWAGFLTTASRLYKLSLIHISVLELVALRLMCAVAQPHIYSETVVIAACAGGEFTTKGKTVKHPGWKALEDAYRAKMKDTEMCIRDRRPSDPRQATGDFHAPA